MATVPRTLAKPLPIPPLEPGDHLSRAEFERRYEAMPHIRKAELIEGVVYIPSPVRPNEHGIPHFDLITWLGSYRAQTPGVRGADNTTVRLDLGSVPQPDALLMIEPSHGGKAVIGEDRYIEGAPELVAEVAASSVSFDLHAKVRVYCRNRVREYVVWRVLDQAVDWFALRGGKYVRLRRTRAGVLQSRVFPGLWLDPAALVRSDLPTVLQVLQEGLATPAHAAFVAKLKDAATRR